MNRNKNTIVFISLITILLISSSTGTILCYQEVTEGWDVYYEGRANIPYDSKFSMLINFEDKGELNYSINVDFNETITLCVMNKSDVEEYHNTSYYEFEDLDRFYYVPKENDGSIKYSDEFNFTISLDNNTKYYLVIDNSEEFGVGTNSDVKGEISLSYYHQPPPETEESPLKTIFYGVLFGIVFGLVILGVIIVVNKYRNSKSGHKSLYPK
ncbi:MAG: hypothetical protein R6U96_10130 [Promethearchaeia archaeon]